MDHFLRTGRKANTSPTVFAVLSKLLGFSPLRFDEQDEDPFVWSEEREGSVVVHEQRSVAVYRNRANGVVIREESPDGADEDSFIVLRDQDAVRAVIDALK